jgi:hypothetical protein
MNPKTKLDLFIDKLIELTSEGRIPWESMVDKRGYPTGFIAGLTIGRVELVLSPESERCLILVTNTSDGDKYYSPPGLDTLIRAAREYIFTPWEVQQMIDQILEGALEDDSERMDNTV